MASIATKALDFDAKGVEFNFSDGTVLSALLDDFTPEVQLHFALHGISQKLGDAYSSAKGDVAVAVAAFKQTYEQLKAGEWRAARGEGDAKPRTTELAEAIARIKGKEVSEIVTFLAAASEEQRKTLRSNDRVKAVIAVIRAEKAQARLAKLDAEGGDDGLGL
jgi:hypothetical protein